MRYYYDTEFLEDGHTIDLISIAIVSEDGREYYAVNRDADWDRIQQDEWLMANVVSQLPPFDVDTWKFKEHIRDQVQDFLLAGGDPELWADYCAYDHVVLAQLWGKMIHLPDGIPMFTNDLRQLIGLMGITDLPIQSSGAHDALADAKHVQRVYRHLTGTES